MPDKSQPVYTYDGFIKLELIETPHGLREVVYSRDSAAIFLYFPYGRQAVFVSQLRLPMSVRDDSDGTLLEVTAGSMEDGVDVCELIAREVLEETGITIAANQVELLNGGVPLATSPGRLTEKMYLAYAEVLNQDIDRTREEFGLAEHGEHTKRIFVPVTELDRLEINDMKTWALVQWFLREKAPTTGYRWGAR